MKVSSVSRVEGRTQDAVTNKRPAVVGRCARGTGAATDGTRESEGCVVAETSGNGWPWTRASEGSPR